MRQLIRDELNLLRRLAADRRDASTRMLSVLRTGLPVEHAARRGSKPGKAA